MKWLLNLLWSTLLILLSPIILWRMIRHGRYRRGWLQKLFGLLPKSDNSRPVVWFHAVSVGEILLLAKIVSAFRTVAGDGFHIVVTTSTDTGYDLATQRFPECTVSWFPLDFTWAVNNALKRVSPSAVVLVELELWPNFLAACRTNGARTALVNARMSEKSFRGYSRISGLVQPLFANLTAVAAQNDEYADRLLKLGVQANRLVVTGSVKFDGVTTDRNNSETRSLQQLFAIQPGQNVFIAGSTQAPEEAAALQAWSDVLAEFPDTRLILVPRHKERFDEVADLVEASGHSMRRRSQLSPTKTAPSDSIILLDTIGELSACWGLADIALVGGSFGSRGGQNMLEPAAYGAAVMFGPKTRNFREIVSQLLAARGAVVLNSPEELTSQLRQFLKDSELQREYGESAQAFVLQQRGALQKTAELLNELLPVEQADGPKLSDAA